MADRFNKRTHLSGLQPSTTVLLERFDPRLELGLLQAIVVDRTNTWNTHPRKTLRPSVHQCAAYRAEAILHPVPGGGGVALLEAREFVFSADMF